ncbi:MAG TPA: YnbE family lipoprotein [Thalassobaculum sp.]
MLLTVAACEPRVRLEAPTEPITINLNIKIEQEVRIKVERDLEQLFERDSKIF